MDGTLSHLATQLMKKLGLLSNSRFALEIAVLFFIHLGTRRVHIAGCTPNPDSAWMQQQARNLSMKFSDDKASCRYIIHDRDASFLPFDFIIKTDGIKIVKTPVHAPMCNAYAERFVREARKTLDNIIPLGERHFRHVLRCIETHHNRQRPHQGIGNLIPEGFDYPEQPADPPRHYPIPDRSPGQALIG